MPTLQENYSGDCDEDHALLSVLPFHLEVGAIGPELFRAACEMGLEGLVSKRCR